MIDKTSGPSSSPGDALHFSAVEESCSLCLQPQLCFHLLTLPPPALFAKRNLGLSLLWGQGIYRYVFTGFVEASGGVFLDSAGAKIVL